MRYLSRCLKCGWNKESDTITTIESFCPKCNDLLVINDSEHDERIAELIDIEQKLNNEDIDELTPEEFRDNEVKFDKVNPNNTDNQIGMYKNIDKFGHKGVWEIIENIKNPIVRVSHRKLFLKVGGKIPNRS